MASMTGWTLFGRGKPKPPKAAVSPAVIKALDELFAGHVEPSEKLRNDYRRYLEARNKRAA